MGGEERASNGDNARDGIQCVKDELICNGFSGNRVENDSGGRFLDTNEGLRTYKRRKYTNKGQDCWTGYVEAASKSADKTAERPPDCFPENHARLDGSNGVSHKQCRNFVLEHIYQSLDNECGGIHGYVQDEHIMTSKRADAGENNKNNSSSSSSYGPCGTHCATRGNADVTSNESLVDSHHPVTNMCHRAFLNIVLSEKFTLLCKLLSENFQEMKPESLLNLSHISIKMKDGIYEHSPSLFHADIQRVWKRIHGIGNELISLANNLSDVSSTSYAEQFRPRESFPLGKPEQMEACGSHMSSCRHCGGKANLRDCLVCDSCEQMYHLSCIEPAVKEIPLKSWYCASCTAGRMGSPHENCQVCERLNAPWSICVQVGDEKGSPTIENVFSEFEETSNQTEDDIHQPAAGGKNVCVCKMCGSEVENGEKVKICEHVDCPYKYYHVRCLKVNMLKSYGPLWYCPSCLCRGCLIDRDDDQIVLCDGCDHAYHTYCMSPPRSSIPRGKWFCTQCDAKIKEIRKAKRACEKLESRMKRKAEADKRAHENLEEKLGEKCEQVSDKDRMDILLTAALYDEKAGLCS